MSLLPPSPPVRPWFNILSDTATVSRWYHFEDVDFTPPPQTDQQFPICWMVDRKFSEIWPDGPDPIIIPWFNALVSDTTAASLLTDRLSVPDAIASGLMQEFTAGDDSAPHCILIDRGFSKILQRSVSFG